MTRKRKTRIVATLGPASSSPARLKQLFKAGVDVVRLNFSHGDHDFFRRIVADVRGVSEDLNQTVAILQDLRGPKMRVGRVADDAIRLRSGDEIQVVEGHGVGDETCLHVEAAGSIARLEKGHTIRLADGLLELRVTGRTQEGVSSRIIHGGWLRSRQGVNIPGADLGVKALTAKDKRDLEFGLELGVDAVALSFVRDGKDIKSLWRFLEKRNARPFVVAKIERAEAMDHLEDILKVTSGVMVARGDLGVELGIEKVPLAQKAIIQAALEYHRPVITATQMLESMIERPTATRAEVSDVANAVLEGTDALMLSAETAVGRYPVEAVRTLVNVAMEAESVDPARATWDEDTAEAEEPALAVVRAARVAARAVQAKAVMGFTNSGRTVRLIASMRPARDIYGFTPDVGTLRRLKLSWGVQPILVDKPRAVSSMVAAASDYLVKRKLVRKGDRIVVVCGEQVYTGSTNSIRIHTVGD